MEPDQSAGASVFFQRRGWLWGTTGLSIIMLGVVGVRLLLGAPALLYDPIRLALFIGYLLVIGGRIWAAQRRPGERDTVVRTTLVGLVYWGMTIPLLLWTLVVIVFWNGVPG